MLSTIHFIHSPCHSTSLESIRTTALSGTTQKTPLSTFPLPPLQLLDHFRVNKDDCFTQFHTENHFSLLSLHTPSHSTSLESIMTADSLTDTERITSPYTRCIPQSLDHFRVNKDNCFTQFHTENHSSLLSLHTPSHSTSLESIMAADSLRDTERITSPYTRSIPQSFDQFRVNNDS